VRRQRATVGAAALPAAFAAVAARAGVGAEVAAGLHAELVARHEEAHRRYHTLEHVAAVLRHLGATSAGLTDRTAVDLAAWYHDAVYDPRAVSGANEEHSAQLAVDRLTGAGVDRALVDDVARLVRVTASHAPTAPDEAALCDADLAVLGADRQGYEAYRVAVRAEYAHVSDDLWRSGRGGVLRVLLAGERIYATAAFAGREPRARENLRRELDTLR
jgi:predicted metal-dependent HD superfamily phosphohydrolase